MNDKAINNKFKTVSDVRNAFTGFFESKGHKHVKSSPLIPENDPSAMFTMAGMMQFKNVFTGIDKRDYSTATTSQKCLRAGGKHNDLENVGYTARHHTFFEMLGNFSFGDYFKEDAISYAWELITKVYGLPVDKLLVTVYHTDEEAVKIWKKVAGLSDDKIIRIATSDNFWSAGDTGPCGPCTEIFYDHGDHIEGGPPGSPTEDGDRFIEIWNIVFMQFDQLEDGSRVPLEMQCIDTGMGLERISAILQNGHSNYDIDIFQDLIKQIMDITGMEDCASHRVISDHLRAASFLIAEGVLPSNEGRGYVLRRIMRRGMRHAHLLGASEPLMHKLFPTLEKSMGGAYPELTRARDLIINTLQLEEARFGQTLDRGMKLLDSEMATLKNGDVFNGETAFKLYDTFGFPLDLTQDVLRGRGIELDVDGFNKAMEAQKTEARKSWAGSGDAATSKIWFDIEQKTGATEFLGYAKDEAEGICKAIVEDGKSVETLKAGDEAILVFNQTPFYAESGGQVGDKGTITFSKGQIFEVSDTRKQVGTLFCHVGTLKSGSIKLKDSANLSVDVARRNDIRAHHSVTHLLHEALRQVLGNHVAQKGSLQDDKRTRFDISHPKALTPDEVLEVERLVNKAIRENTPVETRIMDIDDARDFGALAMFGEKYEDEVRVLSMGAPKDTGKAFSIELCGGTHVKRTGDIGVFRIISDSAVSSGVRRIEAVAGQAAFELMIHDAKTLGALSQGLKVPQDELETRVETLLSDRKKMEKEIVQLRQHIATGGSASDGDDIETINNVPFIGKVLRNIPAGDLKSMVDALKTKHKSAVVTLVSVNDEDGKASVVVGVTSDLTGKVSAVDLVRVASEALGGKGGGGRPDMAQAGGPDGAKAETAMESLKAKIG